MQPTIRVFAAATALLAASQPLFAADLDKGTLTDGAVVQDRLSAGDVEVYEIGANAGGRVDVTFGPTTPGAFAPLLELIGPGDEFVADASSRRGDASLSFTVAAAGIYTVRASDGAETAAAAYTLTYAYSGGTPPSPDQTISLGPNVWHMLMPPAETSATFRNLFVTNAPTPLQADGYFNSVPGGWGIYIWNPNLADEAGTVTGGYRRAELDEAVPSDAGFWFLHLAAGDVVLSTPAQVPFGSRRDRETSTDQPDPGACPDDLVCLRQPLATAGGWTMTGVPTLRPASVDELRFVTDAATACDGTGCKLDEAAGEDLTFNAIYTFDDDSAAERDYTTRAIPSRIQPWQAFWAFAKDGTAGTGFSVTVPVGETPKPPPPPSNN